MAVFCLFLLFFGRRLPSYELAFAPALPRLCRRAPKRGILAKADLDHLHKRGLEAFAVALKAVGEANAEQGIFFARIIIIDIGIAIGGMFFGMALFSKIMREENETYKKALEEIREILFPKNKWIITVC